MKKNLVLFIISICFGFFLMIGYAFFTKKPQVLPIPNLKTIFKSSNFSLEKAPSEALKGKIISLAGDVLWQSRIATDSSKLDSVIEIQQGESLTTKEKSSASIVFDKNLEINLEEKSAIEFIQTLPANIVLFQKFGTVEYKKIGAIPVSIRVLHLLIENKGDILVFLDDQKSIVTVAAISGSAVFSYNDINNVTSVTTLPAGKKLIFNDYSRQAVVE